ncbi:NADP-dependent 3-hydroxy acid dehydrogenase YdfG [Paraburkholderia sp. BL23I1N1]|uniref:SDR family NAD(P)-dependent oxidoreductase n=1 Tax=Paraburkholderia sp. BL23I1N1 TaxID=1938802 RepID=UPI000E70C51D|nr:SDR family oxidoreductase [Paraburkholderia sp. BL23I1N1]RKE38635.1 NADP-dependent 3-hydroxy acid dehydrogenase YdfG [Paraburkholderia sp. BL23I1N1]
MGAEKERAVIVAGGAGAVGEGIVRAFRKAGYAVVIPSRSAKRLEALHAAVGDGLDLVETDLSDPAAAREFATNAAARHGGIEVVVAALGGWSHTGRLLDASAEVWNRVLEDGLTSHMRTAQALAPLVATTRGVYLLINGGAAEQPVPDYGPVSITAAAQAMLMRVLDQELATSGARSLTLLVDSIVATRSREHPKAQWITADEVGRLAVILASPEAAPFAGQVVRAGQLRRKAV